MELDRSKIRRALATQLKILTQLKNSDDGFSAQRFVNHSAQSESRQQRRGSGANQEYSCDGGQKRRAQHRAS
jgi:hypothetical protein